MRSGFTVLVFCPRHHRGTWREAMWHEAGMGQQFIEREARSSNQEQWR
ncbi:hypothetical protein [Halothiobacillus sp.]|nr:hypothetical protein [Halothiobacillus sp.]